MNATITSIGIYHPEKEIYNSYFESFIDTSDTWIRERTGIERRFYTAPNEYTSDMCVKATLNLAKEYNKELRDIDYIIVATSTPDQPMPSVASQVQSRLNIPNAGAIDISSACAGFVNGIILAKGLIASGTHRKILVIGADTLSKVTDFTDRTTCILFGDGANVIFCDVDEKASKKLCDELSDYRCSYLHVDVSGVVELEQAVDRIIEEAGNIDIIINNAGVSPFESILDITAEDFDKVLNINLRPVFVTARALAKHRDANPSLNAYGRIINMASTRYLMSEPNSEAYAASKGAIVSLTHALAISLGKYNITVNSISPGWIDTGHYDALGSEAHSQHPSGRVGLPNDIARTCLFLCQADNNFVNGQNIVVDGGMTKKMIYQDNPFAEP